MKIRIDLRSPRRKRIDAIKARALRRIDAMEERRVAEAVRWRAPLKVNGYWQPAQMKEK